MKKQKAKSGEKCECEGKKCKSVTDKLNSAYEKMKKTDGPVE